MTADHPSPKRAADLADALTERLARHTSRELRYEIKGEIARGGMGAILEVFDEDLRRKLAMKVIRARDDAAIDAASVDKAVLGRFLEEAQVTAQLSHPGVVPVHELGIDAQGRVFFTMSLVKGHDLQHVFEDVHRGGGEWTQTRALGALLRVCETMAYAHSKGVIHRDLKPANVMVGEFGEVYVMDWGLAKLAGESDPHDLRPNLAAAERVTTDRRDVAGVDPSSSLLTMDGTIVGTPSFMSPEQSRGEALDHRSDIYAVGAMLYALLTGRNPYSRPGVSPIGIVQAIHKGPPAAVTQHSRGISSELVAVCEKAMAREPGERYASMQALADDVRAYLEGRVVTAHETGAWAEFRKWVVRNKGTATALLGLLIAVVGGIGVTAYIQNQRADEQKSNAEREYALRLNETREKEKVLRLSDVRVVRELREQQELLWPAVPENSSALSAWVAEAELLHSRLDDHKQSLDALVASSSTNEEALWQIEVLRELIVALEGLPALIETVASRRDFSQTVEERTVTGEEARKRWKDALDDIATMPVYAAVNLTPRLGILPLEPDPISGLWEFWHVSSGAAPVRDAITGRWKIEPDTGIVLVLLPGGDVIIGSTRPTSADDLHQPFVDPHRQGDEVFVEGVPLDPFFCSKYETTQGQWERIIGSNPSRFRIDVAAERAVHPVESVTWNDSERFRNRILLEMPTEVQWEHACRAGTTTIFSCGDAPASLHGFANVADISLKRSAPAIVGAYTQDFDDGFAGPARVGSLEPNGFGLFDMHGNVWEWCLDRYWENASPRSGDGLRGEQNDSPAGAIRGGSWFADPIDARCANRFNLTRSMSDRDLGVRFVLSAR